MCAMNLNSEIPTLKPARDFQFHGKWLIRYDPAEFAYQEILTLLPPLQARLERQASNYKFLNVAFDRNARRSRFFQVGDHLFIKDNGSNGQLAETDPGAFTVQTRLEPLAKPIRSVNLLFPRLESDPRWKTMGLPAAQLFLASSLQANGFESAPMPLILPSENPPSEALAGDMAGFTLFEDLLPALRPFLAHFRAIFNGIIAAGGPMLTLAPMAALYHLPQINLAVRGEGELVLPAVLKALNQGDLEALFSLSGVFWQQPGLIVMSDFDRVNRPETFKNLLMDLSFLKPGHMAQGLEMNFSRGCKRGCIFCCRVQGSKYRKFPLEKAEEILKNYEQKLTEFQMNSAAARSLNINDDDILQDPAYAAAVFTLLKKYGFRIHGIQTAPVSLVQNGEQVNVEVLDLVGDPELYVDNRPLLWLGTDVFLDARARRLGKMLPAPEVFGELLGEFEKRQIRHYHYWISSDGQSDWGELVDEFALVCKFYRDFPNFGLLAHAPFIVPYPASRLFQLLSADAPNLKIREELEAPDPRFSYQVVERLETKYVNLNKLLKNEKACGENGFFDFLKEINFIAAAQLAYHFLKQEQLQGAVNDQSLGRAQEHLEKVISKLLELHDASRITLRANSPVLP
jgi:hypothetical protein